MSQHRLMIRGGLYVVTAERLSPSVWRATGTYMGETHQAQDRREITAVKRWREWAEYKGN